MALSSKVFRYSTPASGSPDAQTGVGFQPKLIMPIGGVPTADATWTSDLRVMVGGGVSSSERFYASLISDDTAGTSDSKSRWSSSGIVHLYTSAGADNSALADLSTLDADGFTYTWSNFSARKHSVWCLGGADLTNVKILSGSAAGYAPNTSTGNKAYTGVGFQPDLVIVLAVAGVTDGTTANDLMFGMGAFDKDGHQWAWAIAGQDNQASANAKRIQDTSHCVYSLTAAGAVDYSASWVSMGADGFTLNFDDAGGATQDLIFICIKGPSVNCGSFAKPTGAAPASKVVTGVGFQPTALMLAGDLLAAVSGAQAGALFSLGFADGTTSGALTAFDDGGTSGAQTYTDAKCYIKGAIGATVAASATLTTFDSDGFTLSFGVNDGVADEIFYVALGNTPAAGGTPKLLALTGVG